MSLFDVIDDVAQRQTLKSTMGDNRIFGTVIGTVTNNYNKELPGRVCVQIPLRDQDANVLQWARIAMPYAGKNWGEYFVPEIGDQVLLTFEDGNIEKPFVIGCVAAANSSFFSKQSDENNQNKCITSKNGNTIRIVDNAEGDGEKDKIEIKTAKNELMLSLDNEFHKVSLTDKDKKNYVNIDTENGAISIIAEKKLSIKVGDAEILINGESGKISVKCAKTKLVSEDNIKVESSGICKYECDNIILSAGKSMKISGGNTTTISGQIIQLG